MTAAVPDVFGLPALVWLGLQAHTDLIPPVDRTTELARIQAATLHPERGR